MSKEEMFEKLRQGIYKFDREATEKAAKEVVEKGFSPIEALKVLMDAVRQVGEMFASGDIFLPELILAAEAMKAGVKVLTTKIPKEKISRQGTILIGTVKGDIHDIGKNIVATMLSAAGFEVYDAGVDMPPSTFVEQAERIAPDIVAISALMTTTLPELKNTIDYFKAVGIRDKYKIMVGGAPVTKNYANEIGADGYAEDAVEAVKVAKELIRKS